MQRIVASSLLLLAALTSQPAAAQNLPTLAVNTPFALRASTLSFTVTGAPGATVQLLRTSTPAEVDLGAGGIQFFKSGTQTAIASATIPAGGTVSKDVKIPFTAKAGDIFYVQAQTSLGGQLRLSNAVTYRIETAAPSGARETVAVAATPDGKRAYVAHNEGGIVTVIDAVADRKLTELPVTVDDGGIPHRPLRIAIDPEGRHAFVSNTNAATLTVIHAPTGSISAQIAVPRGNRGVGFDFRNGQHRIYVANEAANAVLVFDEAPLGTFVAKPSIPLQGHAPGPLLVLADGRLAVGVRTEAQVEILDPAGAAGSTTVARTDTGGVPFDLALNGSEILVPSFVPGSRVEGTSRVLRIDGASFQVLGGLFDDIGTDYRRITAQPAAGGAAPFIVIGGAGSGTALFADGISYGVLQNIELAPGDPTATPQDLAIVRDPVSGLPAKLYVADYFRETVRPIVLSGGLPFTLAPEIALAWSGQVRVPLSGTLTDDEDGEWFFRSVNLLGGTALAPNRVTCDSCHIEGSSDNLRLRDRQVPAAWGLSTTAPYGWQGTGPTLSSETNGALNAHNHSGNPGPAGADTKVIAYFNAHTPPESIYKSPDGTLSADQQAGKTLFEGAAQCSSCHTAPNFIPTAKRQRTIAAGIGTGLAPINVPSLRGAWATAPYLHDGSATTLMDVLTINPNDAHGQRAAPLTQTQRQQLVEYLKTL